MSRGGSSKSQLFLMEFICVVVFFALCAALCINAFVKADAMSKEGRAINQGLLIAQSVAETIKAMENPTKEKIDKEVENVNKNGKEAYIVEVDDKIVDNMLLADVVIYSAEKNETKVCSVSVKKYVPNGVEYED